MQEDMILYKVLPEPHADFVFSDTSQSCKTSSARGVPIYSLAFAGLINRPRSDRTWSLRWYTVATSGI